MPNRRRRKLSTAMSAVAALAVASPCAYFLVYESTAGNKAPEHHEFKQAAVMSDLPGELMGALSQGLSQFGISLPPVPALSGGATSTPGLASPGLGTPGLGTPGLTNPGLTSPGATSPDLTSPGLTSPGLTSPAVAPSEVPIASGAGLDPGAGGTYPILGDPSTFGNASPIGGGGSGGLVNDAMQAANQLGAGQAIDLLKGLVMPAITQGIHGGAAGALPGAAGALPTAAGAAGALPAAAGAAPALPPV
ncbi:hypothetical protein MLM_0150 [Mycobacterium lepraemurium]|nr:PirG [Mycobacterium lepraemurium]ATA27248.1 hypothetical protein MLM_0150 [Mycobacterium lepraemurium]